MSVCFLIESSTCGKSGPGWDAARAWLRRRLSGKVDAVFHEPVMVDEVLEALPVGPGAVIVDGTLGLGGHSLRFLDRIQPGGTLIGFDWDRNILDEAKRRLGSRQGATIHLINDSFTELENELERLQLKADGVLLDLGLNSAQVDDRQRGLSFLGDGPLDMRMDQSRGEPASALLNRLSSTQIADILERYGDERWAVAIARKITERRRDRPLKTTADLVECVLAAIPAKARDKRIHPATRSFQAVRIAVNNELELLKDALHGAARSLKPGGVLAVISYHSGEDRIVKQTFRELAEVGFEEAYRKPRLPSKEETLRNPRSRSAKMRALKRLESMQT